MKTIRLCLNLDHMKFIEVINKRHVPCYSYTIYMEKYSVLMSLYIKEKPEYLELAIKSMSKQSFSQMKLKNRGLGCCFK
ncbi:hypothetical protein SDC9_81683 [bioreactor metagenome]|uniref:Uncharacterized protein n=1 Tax=bioreactor metagenome TaxID=1076179 RepID=A0A644Z8P9_9ZZZZ